MPCLDAKKPVNQSLAAAEAAVFCLVNEERRLAGVNPLTPNKKLGDAARAHANAAVAVRWWPAGGGSVVHTNPQTGSTPQQRIKDQGYCPDDDHVPMNENAYTGWYTGQPGEQSSPYAVVVGFPSKFSWKNSSDHYKTMTDPQYTEGGVAIVDGIAQQEPILDDSGNPVHPDGGFTVVMTFGGCRKIALEALGKPLAWGQNPEGQVGDGTTTERLTPVPVANPHDGPPLADVVAVSAGSGHSLALVSDGSVWAWGRNNDGELGDGSTTNRLLPTRITGLDPAFAIAAGDRHSLAVASAGTVWAWGDNEHGQLGIGNFIDQNKPIKVAGLPSIFFIRVAAGWGHSMALSSFGSVYAWGANSSGQLGNPIASIFIPNNIPVPVLIDGVVSIAAGTSSSLALKSDGTVWAWGGNAYGELGTGDTTLRTSPVQVMGLTDVSAIAMGAGHSLALTKDGSVWAWGDNQLGQLGDDTTISRLMPTKVSSLSEVAKIASGGVHSLALKTNGTVWAWGSNSQGQLGIGTKIDQRKPEPVPGPSMAGIEGGHAHSLGITPIP